MTPLDTVIGAVGVVVFFIVAVGLVLALHEAGTQ